MPIAAVFVVAVAVASIFADCTVVFVVAVAVALAAPAFITRLVSPVAVASIATLLYMPPPRTMPI